jgi:hypothetical protein
VAAAALRGCRRSELTAARPPRPVADRPRGSGRLDCDHVHASHLEVARGLLLAGPEERVEASLLAHVREGPCPPRCRCRGPSPRAAAARSRGGCRRRQRTACCAPAARRAHARRSRAAEWRRRDRGESGRRHRRVPWRRARTCRRPPSAASSCPDRRDSSAKTSRPPSQACASCHHDDRAQGRRPAHPGPKLGQGGVVESMETLHLQPLTNDVRSGHPSSPASIHALPPKTRHRRRFFDAVGHYAWLISSIGEADEGCPAPNTANGRLLSAHVDASASAAVASAQHRDQEAFK